MAKRRTLREKKAANHQFLIHLEPTAVNRQTGSLIVPKNQATVVNKNTNLSQDFTSITPIKKAIIKSLFLAFLIIGLELVIYSLSR